MVQKGDIFYHWGTHPLNWDVPGQTGMYTKSMNNKVINYLVLDCLKM